MKATPLVAARQSWPSAASGVVCVLIAAMLAPIGPLDAQQLNESAITGLILSAEDDSPLPQAAIRLDGTDLVVLADPTGRFRMDRVPPGPYVMRVDRLGYATRVDTLFIEGGTVVDLTIRLSVEPIELEPIVAVIRSLVLERAGYYVREAQGFGGHFIDRPEILEENPTKVTDLFRSLPGIRVVYGGIYGSQVFVNQRVTFADGMLGCQPSVWLDGIRSTMRSYDMMRTEEMEGIEVYAGGGPGKFNDVCGSILIWTRVPIKQR